MSKEKSIIMRWKRMSFKMTSKKSVVAMVLFCENDGGNGDSSNSSYSASNDSRSSNRSCSNCSSSKVRM